MTFDNDTGQHLMALPLKAVPNASYRRTIVNHDISVQKGFISYLIAAHPTQSSRAYTQCLNI
jgi:hypothetical protein